VSEASPSPTSTASAPLTVVLLPHPQGCRGYLIVDPETRAAAAVDVHLDRVAEAATRVSSDGWDLRFVVDTHTHADHPSGARKLADWFGARRVAHRASQHRGVVVHPEDGEALDLGSSSLRFLHAPGHTPDHLVVTAGGALFSGDSLFIGSVARTDFLGGDAGVLWDSLQRLLGMLPPETLLYPGHDYRGRTSSTLGAEASSNPWLALPDRATFVARLTANPPPRPANMDALLRLNREGEDIPPRIAASDVIARVHEGGAASIVDVRTDVEVAAERIPGSRHIPIDQVEARAEEVRATPAPRLLLCRSGSRALRAQRLLDTLGVQATSVVEGGIEAYKAAGGAVATPRKTMPMERQVLIAAGAVVLLGSALAALVHWAFLALPALVGGALLVAGLTRRCGITAGLRLLPCNREARAVLPQAAGGCAATLPPRSCAAD
jgi:glyoxylase-like metal-dependent hydrolase (beta-lactamase superfamily II)/rhodanese-related sulfurtransferase